MNRTDRLYALVEELRAAGDRGRTGAWLAQRFEVTTRTIKRDVSALQQSGAAIWAQPGPGGGYVLDPAATMPPVAFTVGEAVALAIAVNAHTAADHAPFVPDARSALTKLLGVMPTEQHGRALALAGQVWMRGEPRPRPPWARTVEEALRSGVVLVIDYEDRSGAATARRVVEPMAFAQSRGHWYLLAWCRRRRGGRWFRLDRITGADLTTEAAPHRDLLATFGTPPADATTLPV